MHRSDSPHDRPMIWFRRRPRSFAWSVAVVLLATASGLSAAACAADSGAANAPRDSDRFAAIDDLRSDLRSWNRESAVIVGAYLDDSVGADEFVAVATPVLESMEGVLRRMRQRDLSDLPADASAIVRDVLSAYDDKLSALNRMTTSIAIGDASGEQSGVAKLQQANSEANSAACDLINLLDDAGADDFERDEFGC